MKIFKRLTQILFNEWTLISGLIVVLLIVTIIGNLTLTTADVFPHLAWSFLNGKTYFISEIFNPDIINWQGHLYWHMPPFPAIVLIPIVIINQGPLSQGIVNVILNILLFYFIYKFCHSKFQFNKHDSIWLAILFLFGSIYINSIFLIEAYYYAQIITTILMFLALWEFYGLKRYWLIGIYISLIFLTRYMAAVVLLFFILYIITEKTNLKNKFYRLCQLAVPILLAIFVLLSYNYVRFSEPFVNTYTNNGSYQRSQHVHPYGFFSLKYLPNNLYYYFIEGPKPILDPEYIVANDNSYILKFPYFMPEVTGCVSFFLIAPFFLYIFKANYKKRVIKYAFLTSGLITFLLLIYYYNGFPQIGPRYLLDVLPLLFLILLYVFQPTGLNYKHKLLITLSVIFNIYLWFTWYIRLF